MRCGNRSLDPAEYPLVPALPGYGITRDTPVPVKNLGVRRQALISGWNITGTTIQGAGTIDGQGQVSTAAAYPVCATIAHCTVLLLLAVPLVLM